MAYAYRRQEELKVSDDVRMALCVLLSVAELCAMCMFS